MLLLFLAMGFGFSGYLLPWNTLAFFATKVGTEITGQVPVIGHPMMVFLRGGEDVTGATLTRFFGFHVAVLPGLTTLLILLHLVLVQYFGMSVPPSVEREAAGKEIPSYPFVPSFLLRDIIGWYIALGVLAALAALFPGELGVKADPFAATPVGIRPEWYFLFLFQTLKIIPGRVLGIEGEQFAVLLFGLAALLWLSVPFFDRDLQKPRTRLFTAFGATAILYIIAMSLWAWRS
jgi:cytochrome b6